MKYQINKLALLVFLLLFCLFPIIQESPYADTPENDLFAHALKQARAGKLRKAIDSWESIISLYPDAEKISKVYGNIGIAYHNLGEIKKSISYYKKALELETKATEIIRVTGNYGKALHDLGEWENSNKFLKKLINMDPNGESISWSYCIIADNYLSLEKPKEAIPYYEKGVTAISSGKATIFTSKETELGDCYGNLSVAYVKDKQYQKAIDPGEKAIKFLKIGVLYTNLGEAYYYLKQYEKAKQYYKRGISLGIDDLTVAGNIYLIAGMVADALGEGEKAISYTLKAKNKYRKTGDANSVSLAGHNLRIYYNKYEGKNQPQPVVEKPRRATGTGFLLGSSNYIITNYHVVKGFNSLQVNFLGGEKSKAKLRANDKANDVAVLELLNPPNLATNSMMLGDSSSVEMGEKVFTIGYPVSGVLGKKPKYAEGVISSTTGISDDPRMFQITVPIQPGNSGGPLFNNKGEVIGITTSSLDALKAFEIMGAIPQNVNFAVKSDYVKALLQSIPDSMTSTRSIVVVPSDLETRVSGLIKQVKNNIVLVEASTDNSLPAFVELDDAKSNPVVETKRKVDLKEKVRLAKKRQAEIDDRFKTLKEMESLDDSLISIEEKQEAIKKFIKDYPDRNPRLEEAQQMLELIVQ